MLRVILILLTGYKVFDLVQGVKSKISFDFLMPKRGDIKLGDEILKIRLRITNGNPIGFNINKVEGIFSKGNRVLGEIESTQIHYIPANGKKDLVSEIEFDSSEILFSIAENLENKNWQTPMIFKGIVYVEGRRFRVIREIKFSE